jgi:ribosome-binding protein aMBF1 (putative translation factor)
MIDTTGRKQLEHALKQRNLSQAALARALRISAVSVNAWVAGRSRPECHWRRALEALLAIDSLDWDTDEERAQCTAAIARGRSLDVEAA